MSPKERCCGKMKSKQQSLANENIRKFDINVRIMGISKERN